MSKLEAAELSRAMASKADFPKIRVDKSGEATEIVASAGSEDVEAEISHRPTGVSNLKRIRLR